jgi:hypothetical protein
VAKAIGGVAKNASDIKPGNTFVRLSGLESCPLHFFNLNGDKIMQETNDIAAMFEGDSSTDAIAELAERIVYLEEEIGSIDKEQVKRKESLLGLKASLAELLVQNGMESCKLENGLNPKHKTVVKVFKGAGVTDDVLFSWLNEHNLEGIIKPTVHWGTLNKTMLEWAGEGNELPEIFNMQSTPSVTMYGKSKFLANKAEASAASK